MDQKEFNVTIVEKPSCYRKNKSGWYLNFGDNKPAEAGYVERQEYRCHGDALIAAGIALNMLEKQKNEAHPRVEVSEFDFLVRATLRLTDSPNK